MSTPERTQLTREEEVFRIWMRISFWTYAFGAVFFLLWGAHIPANINYISAKLLPLPLYPLPFTGPEGAFWRVLAVSMMVMLTWICRAAYVDIRANANLVPILLISKLCSTSLYFLLFLVRRHFAYLVGALTDGPIFVLTAALWFQAMPAGNYLTRKEEDILVALGNAMLPRGGAFALGYPDLRDAAVADARRMFAALDTLTLTGLRLGLRMMNAMPLIVDRRLATLLKLDETERESLLLRLETHRWAWVRKLMMLVKVHIVVPFFNQTEAARAVGYDPETPLQP